MCPQQVGPFPFPLETKPIPFFISGVWEELFPSPIPERLLSHIQLESHPLFLVSVRGYSVPVLRPSVPCVKLAPPPLLGRMLIDYK